MANNGIITNKPVFLGILFPFQKGANGIPATATDFDIIKSDLLLLFNTRKGERVMLPEFGLDLERLVFENTGPLLRAKAFRQISDALANFESRVSVINVAVAEQQNTVIIDVQYIINGFQDQLSIEVGRDNGN